MKYVDKLVMLTLGMLMAVFTAQGQRFEWGMLLNTNNKVTAAVDGAGNSYVFGVFRNQITLGNTTLTSSNFGSADLFVAKFRPDGSLRWLRQAGSYYNEDIGRIAADDHGNVFLTGSHGDLFSYGHLMLASEGHFLARLDTATGSPIWLRRLEGSNTSGVIQANALAIGRDGDCYLTGSVTAVSYFDQLPIQNPGTRPNAFVARYERGGLLKWVTQVLEDNSVPSTAAVMIPKAIAVNPGGELAIGGTFRGRYLAGQGIGQVSLIATDTSSTATYRDAFVLRFGASGGVRWGKVGAGLDNQTINGIALDELGSTYVAGGSANTLSFGAGQAPVIGCFVARFDSYGQTQWLRGQTVTSPSYFSRDDAVLDMVADNRGNTSMTGMFAGAGLILGRDTLANGVYPGAGITWNLFAAGYDPYGNVRWTKADTDTATAQGYFSGGRIGADKQGRIYILGIGYGVRTYDNVVINAAGSVGRSFMLRIEQPYQRVSGRIYLDQNANSIRDSGEPFLPVPLMVVDPVQDRGATSFSSDGHYSLWLPAGAYNVQVPELPRHYYLTQGAAGYQGTLPAYGNDSTLHFGVAPVPNQPDVRISLAPYTQPRPGLITRYRATLENVGTTVAIPDTVGVRLDSRMAFISSSPVATQYLPDPTYYWPASPLAPFERREFDLQFSTPVNVPVGTVIKSTSLGRMSADVLMADNRDTLVQEVAANSANNSVSVNLQNITHSQLAAGRALEYTFFFQNLGNDTVQNVMILDTIDFSKIKRGAITYGGSSHSCTWSVGSDNVLRVQFGNIRLPSRNVDVLNSRGFIMLRMVPLPTLTDGVIIENTAHIVFDFNNPIRTNTVRTIIGNAGVGLPEALQAPTWSIFPNPTDHRATLTATLPATGLVQVQVLDPLGRELQHQTLTAANVDFRYDLNLTDVAPGLYLVRLTAPNGSTVSRRLVRR